MVDVGEGVFERSWDRLYDALGGNPWAAMPSLHFATSLMAALLLAEIGPLPGALGAAYAATLAFALVYLGEHYVTDLLAGAAVVALVRRGEPVAEPLVDSVNGVLQRLERIAAG
jgi:PAP2 superfamily